MKRYEKNINDRKILVDRLAALTEESPVYTRLPRCAFQVGAFFVEKDGTLTAEDGADESIIRILADERLIGGEMENTTTTNTTVEEEPNTAAEAEQPVVIVPQDENEDWGEDEEEQEASEEEAEPWMPSDEPTTEPDAAEAATEPQEGAEETEANVEPTAEPDAAEAATEPQEGTAETDSTEGTTYPMDLEVSFPLAKHTGNSIVNLVCMIYSRGSLVSKATAGTFQVSKALADAMVNHGAFHTCADAVHFLSEWQEDGLTGIRFGEDKVVFDGFRDVPDADHAHAYSSLAAAMNKMALTQKRIRAKEVDESNEKYALRVWMTRLDINGSEFKADRKILMERLSGHTAFRTKADEEKWKEQQKAKRDAARAAAHEASRGTEE